MAFSEIKLNSFTSIIIIIVIVIIIVIIIIINFILNSEFIFMHLNIPYLIHSSLYSFVRWFIHLFIYPFIHLFVHSFTHSFIRSSILFINVLIWLFTPVCLLAHLFFNYFTWIYYHFCFLIFNFFYFFEWKLLIFVCAKYGTVEKICCSSLNYHLLSLILNIFKFCSANIGKEKEKPEFFWSFLFFFQMISFIILVISIIFVIIHSDCIVVNIVYRTVSAKKKKEKAIFYLVNVLFGGNY